MNQVREQAYPAPGPPIQTNFASTQGRAVCCRSDIKSMSNVPRFFTAEYLGFAIFCHLHLAIHLLAISQSRRDSALLRYVLGHNSFQLPPWAGNVGKVPVRGGGRGEGLLVISLAVVAQTMSSHPYKARTRYAGFKRDHACSITSGGRL